MPLEGEAFHLPWPALGVLWCP